MVIFWSILLTLPFFLPMHFYPLPTYPEELITAIWVVFFASFVVLKNKNRIYANSLLFWWVGFGIVWLISWSFNVKQISSAAHFYQIFWVIGSLAILCASGLIASEGRERAVYVAARVLVFAGFLYASLGLFNYYGGLKFLIPWISKDEPRLVGLMAHPNLSALYLALSLSAFVFLVKKKDFAVNYFLYFVYIFVVLYAAVLTGSRAFYLILFAQLVLSLVWLFVLPNYERRQGSNKKVVFLQAVLLVASISFLFTSAPIDRSISGYLKEKEVLVRVSADEMLSQRFSAAGQPRLGEWRKIVEGWAVIDNILVGVGPGSYSEFSVKADEVILDPYRNGKTWRNAHNIFLMAFVEWGILGVLFTVAFLVYGTYIFINCKKDGYSLFLWSVLVSIFSHNLVEFSLWHMQFLVLFIFFFSFLLPQKLYRISFPATRWALVVPAVILTLWFSYSSGKDFNRMVYLFSKPDIDRGDVKHLDLVAQNTLWRPYSRLVMYFRLNPYSTGLENQLREASLVVEWSSLNLAMMRQASLTAGLGNGDLACVRISRASELYPAIVPTLREELAYLVSEGLPIDLDKLESCFAKRGVR